MPVKPWPWMLLGSTSLELLMLGTLVLRYTRDLPCCLLRSHSESTPRTKQMHHNCTNPVVGMCIEGATNIPGDVKSRELHRSSVTALATATVRTGPSADSNWERYRGRML